MGWYLLYLHYLAAYSPTGCSEQFPQSALSQFPSQFRFPFFSYTSHWHPEQLKLLDYYQGWQYLPPEWSPYMPRGFSGSWLQSQYNWMWGPVECFSFFDWPVRHQSAATKEFSLAFFHQTRILQITCLLQSHIPSLGQAMSDGDSCPLSWRSLFDPIWKLAHRQPCEGHTTILISFQSMAVEKVLESNFPKPLVPLLF